MKKKMIIPALIIALTSAGAVGVVGTAESAEAAGCTISATSPWSVGKTIYVRAGSNCRGTVESHLRWSRPGFDTNLASNSVYGRSVTSSKACTWGVPKDRNIFSFAKRGASSARSGVKGYTSKNSGRCTK